MTEITVDKFTKRLEKNIEEFRIYWKKENNASTFPNKLPSPEEWIEQFLAWLG